ncbi:hypothetical protein [Rhizobium sp.]|uniref:hypothetical protein n=1 Tax=Rhizobium sp. TaxID=391 RepID=UPI0028A651C0
MLIFKSRRSVVRIRTQYLVWYQHEDGSWHRHYFDFCIDYANGRRSLYDIRNLAHVGSVIDVQERIRNQDLHKYAHDAFVWTEKQISKPAVYRATQILRARQMNNESNNRLMLQSLKELGGCARLGHVLQHARGVPHAHGHDAIWALIDRGLVAHDHYAACSSLLKLHSWVSLTEKVSDGNH